MKHLTETDIQLATQAAEDLIKATGGDKDKAVELATDQMNDAYHRYQFMFEVKLQLEKA